MGLNGNDLTVGANKVSFYDTSIEVQTDDTIDIDIADSLDFEILANIFRALSGSVFETDTINETTADAGVTVDGVLLKDGTITPGGLTAGRVAIVGTGGILTDDAELLYNATSNTLTTSNIGAFTLGGKLTAGSSEIEGSSFDINGGTVDSITSLTVSNSVDIGNFNIRSLSGTFDSLTSGRVPFASTDGLLIDDADFTFSTDTLTVTKLGAFEATGAINFASQNMTNVDIDSGTVDAITSLTVANDVDVGSYTVTAERFKANRVNASSMARATHSSKVVYSSRGIINDWNI